MNARGAQRAIEHCECCLLEAPGWDQAEYSEWWVEIDERGNLVGVWCVGCGDQAFRHASDDSA